MSSINPARTMERALRKAIAAAVKQVATKTYEHQPEDVTEAFITDLFLVLFPAPVKKERKTKSTASATDTESSGTDSEGKKERKKPGPKPKAKPAAEEPKEKKKPGPKPKVDAEGNPIAKKKPGPKPKSKESGAESDASASSKASKTSEKKKPGPKPKAKSAAEPNVDTLTAGKWKKAKEAGVTDKKAFIAYLNGLAKEAFDAQKIEVHAAAFAKPVVEAEPVVEAVVEPVAPAEDEEQDAVEVQFKDKTYYVEPESKKVYEKDGEEFEFLGYAGMGAFKGMVLPDDE